MQQSNNKVSVPLFDSSDVPNTWEGIYNAAQELKQVREAIAPILDKNKQGFISLHLRPTILETQKELEKLATKQFGLLGRLALVKKTPELTGTELLPLPSMVLVFAVHSAILNAGFVCTGSASSEFAETENWPDVLPSGWLDDSGSKFSFRYRSRSGAADKLVWKGVVMTDLLALSANDPYSDGKDAMTMHLRIKDFIANKAGEAPKLLPSKERELISVIEERVIPVAGGKPGSKLGGGSEAPPAYVGGGAPFLSSMPQQGSQRGGSMFPQPPDFHGDLLPGVGGSMFFGPGNPDFDSRFGNGGFPGVPGSNPRGRLPEARFDPYGPFKLSSGDPDPDEFPKLPGVAGRGGNNFQDFM